MGIVNWRREALFMAIAGMESCWIVGISRMLLRQSGRHSVNLAWWSAWTLFIVALWTARTVGRLESRRATWAIVGLALVTSLLMLQLNAAGTSYVLSNPTDPSTVASLFALLFNLFIWMRALRIPSYAGYMRAINRQFQVGVLIMALLVIASLQVGGSVDDLVMAYFGFGLLAVALTRIEEVSISGSAGSVPLNRKWAVALGSTILLTGTATLLATRVLTVDTLRWLLRPFVTLFTLALYLFVLLATELIVQLLPLLKWILGDISMEGLQESVDDVRQFTSPFSEEEVPEPGLLSPQLQEVLWVSFVALLILVALWVVVRSFRHWRAARYTPGGTRETVEAAGTLADDLAAFLRDQWRRLRELDLRRLFERLGTGSARAIYASMLALLAAADHPREPEQTPYEYEPVAEGVLPGREADIRAITEAYVQAHYGERDISADELAALQGAWQRVRAEGQELLRTRNDQLE